MQGACVKVFFSITISEYEFHQKYAIEVSLWWEIACFHEFFHKLNEDRVGILVEKRYFLAFFHKMQQWTILLLWKNRLISVLLPQDREIMIVNVGE